MHLVGKSQPFPPFPPVRHFDDRADRRDANRAVGASATGLAVTGVVELAVALISGSVGLLGDALHNLSDVSTSAVVFLGFRTSRRPARPGQEPRPVAPGTGSSRPTAASSPSATPSSTAPSGVRARASWA